MAFAGGVFSLVAGNPVVTGTTISSTWANNTLSDIASNGLTTCLLKDGTQTLTANIPFSGFGITNTSLIYGGSTNGLTVASVIPAWQTQGTATAAATHALLQFSADANAGNLAFVKSRNATIGSHTIVQSGDDLGAITAYGSNGTTADPAAQILFESGGTPGAVTDMPGRIRFFTTPDGSATLTEAMRITNEQYLIVGSTDETTNNASIQGFGNASRYGIYVEQSATAGVACIDCNSNGSTGDNALINMKVQTALVGLIDYNRAATLTRYNTTSCEGLKVIHNADAPYAPPMVCIQRLKDAKVREFHWKGDPEQKVQLHFVAQELYQVYPGAVSVGHGEPGDPDYRPWMVDKTAFQQHLVAGWQDHEKRLSELEMKMAARGG